MVKAGIFLKDFDVYTPDDMIQSPKISVIMPTYCRGDNGLMERSINSVLSQTFRELELIVVDDGSVDNTQNVVKRMMKEDNRIVYIRNNINSGLPGLKVNQGIMHARADIIAYQFDDDQWYEDGLENLYNELSRCSIPSFVYGKCRYVDVVSNVEGFLGTFDFDYKDIVNTNLIANNSVIHHKELAYIHGGYDPHLTMRRLCDWDLWQRWFKAGVNFKRTESTVSYVECNQPQSLFRIAVHDMGMHRLMESRQRNDMLCLDRIHEYLVDDIEFINDASLKNKIYYEHVLPWKIIKEPLIDESITVKPDDMLNILVVKRQYDASVDICLKNFAKASDKNYNIIFCPVYQLEASIINYADVVVMLRSFEELTPKTKEKLKSKPVIYMLDDDLINLHTYDPEKFAELLPTTANYKNLIEYIKGADLCVTFSDNLTSEIQNHNSQVFQMKTNILDKYLESGHESYEDNKSAKKVLSNQTEKESYSSKIKIAYCGGDSRKEELDFFIDDIKQILEKHRNTAELYFYGYMPDDLKSFENVIHMPFDMNYYNYMDKLSDQHFDIFLSPLFEDRIKTAKSPVKYLESAVCGSIGIYSVVNVYETVEDNTTGIKIQNEKGSLFQAIEKIIHMPKDHRDKIVENAKADIQKRYSTKNQLMDFELMLQKAYFNHHIKNRNITLIRDNQTEISSEILKPVFTTLQSMAIKLQILDIGFVQTDMEVEDMIKELDIPVVQSSLDFHGFDVNEMQFKQDFKEHMNENNIALCIVTNNGFGMMKSIQENHINYIPYDIIKSYCKAEGTVSEKSGNVSAESEDRPLQLKILMMLNSYIQKNQKEKDLNQIGTVRSENTDHIKLKIPVLDIGEKKSFVPLFDELRGFEIKNRDIIARQVDIKIYAKSRTVQPLFTHSITTDPKKNIFMFPKSLRGIKGKQLYISITSPGSSDLQKSIEVQGIFTAETL